MTCIIGYQVDENTCYMGADSCGSANDNEWQRKDRKIFVKDDILYSFTSSFRMGNLLRWKFTPPSAFGVKGIMTNEEYVNTVFIDAIRKLFKEHGFMKIDNSREDGGSFLVAVGGELFHIEDDLQVAQQINGIYADGCGFITARGYLMAEQESKRFGPGSMIKALIAAGKTTSGVCGPYILYKQDAKGTDVAYITQR